VHLAAAGLSGGKLNRVPKPLQNLYDGFSCRGKERVVITGDKKRNLQAATPKFQ
jgi:hypothetical protein